MRHEKKCQETLCGGFVKRVRLLGSFGMVVGYAGASFAQAPPNAPQPAALTAPGVFTAMERYGGVTLYNATGLLTDDGRSRVADTARSAALAARTRAWLVSLQGQPVHGIQIDALGGLFVSVGDDEKAQQQFAARLATPHLEVGDRAYTLVLAIRLFGQDTVRPERMKIALEYMHQLDALPSQPRAQDPLPTDLFFIKFSAHEFLAERFYLLGDNANVIPQVRAAFATLPGMRYGDRSYVYVYSMLLQWFVECETSLPQGRAAIDSMVTFLKQHATVPAEEVAKDPELSRLTQSNLSALEANLRSVRLAGTHAPPIYATHWYNMSAPTAAPAADVAAKAPSAKAQALDDGVIRLIQLGDRSCAKCIGALPGLDRIRKQAPPGVQVIYATQTLGFFGASMLDPDQEAAALSHWYTVTQGYGFGIAMWAGVKAPQDDGGMLPYRSPTIDTLSCGLNPMFVVTDGRGIIRDVFVGAGNQHEHRILKLLDHLAAEAKHEPTTHGATALAPATSHPTM